MADARRRYPDFDVTRGWDLPDVPARPGEDLDAYLRRLGFTDTQLAYTERGFAGAAGEPPRHLDAATSLNEMRDTSAGSGDWRILDGYDALLARLAAGLDICLETAVVRVDWAGPGVRVETADGRTFEADRAVVTLPLGVLQAGAVRFAPDLPAGKRDAIARLGVAPVLKLVYRFAEPVLPPGVMALYAAGNPAMWWSPSFGRDAAETVMTAFVTGDRARALLALGEPGALARGLDVLRAELDRPDLRSLDARVVNWPADPYSRGGYSVTPPGAADAHAALAAPVERRLYWAGEAAAGPVWKATVHGAFASGERAAADILFDRNDRGHRDV